MTFVPSAFVDQILRCAPSLAGAPMEFITDGLVNDVVIVDGRLVFRFPKNDNAARDLLREAKVLDLVRRHVTLAVPDFRMHDGPFVSYARLPGAGLRREDILRLDERRQNSLAAQLSEFLRQLHDVSQEEARRHGIEASSAERTREDWLRLLRDVEREVFPLLMAHAREWIAQHFAPLVDGRLSLEHEPALVHADLGPYHILYDRATQQITGVLDFGTAGLGDPADDVANVIHGLGETFLRRMLPFYPAISGLLDRARFQAGTLELQWALHGLRSNDRSWLVCHIGRARDVWPIGVV